MNEQAGQETTDAPEKTEAKVAEEKIKAEEKAVVSCEELIGKLADALTSLINGTLILDGTPVPQLTEPAKLELEYSEKKGVREFEIEIKW